MRVARRGWKAVSGGFRRWMWLWVCLGGGAVTGVHQAQDGEAEGYRWVEEPGKHMDLVKGGQALVRYVHEGLDDSTPARREETYKPFHHVFPTGEGAWLTKGPGGQFTHHRGIYFGFSRCHFVNDSGEKETVDSWHCKKGYQSHEEILEQAVTERGGFHRVRIDWCSDASGKFLTEERRVEIEERKGGMMVDFRSELTTELEGVELGGDPQHAGFHFRASNEVNEATKSQTYYIRPGSGRGEMGKTINAPKNLSDEAEAGTRNVPWKGMSVVVAGKRYTVAYLDHPGNPKPADFSERDYGRFGSYFEARVTPENPVRVSYRLFIREGEMTEKEIEELSQEFILKETGPAASPEPEPGGR